jgi:hypothetical protein
VPTSNLSLLTKLAFWRTHGDYFVSQISHCLDLDMVYQHMDRSKWYASSLHDYCCFECFGLYDYDCFVYEGQADQSLDSRSGIARTSGFGIKWVGIVLLIVLALYTLILDGDDFLGQVSNFFSQNTRSNSLVIKLYVLRSTRRGVLIRRRRAVTCGNQDFRNLLCRSRSNL